MFGISYNTWQKVCDMYFSLDTGSQKAYLQWFPLTKLSYADKKMISGEEFYATYIKTASFVFFPHAMHQSENYMQKSDGSFRDSSLIAPILFLLLQSIGLEIHDYYSPIRPPEISVYYAGNYKFLRPKYKQDYNDFFKELNVSIDEYRYFIKTDITNFFANISVDKLIAQVDKICNSDAVIFSQTQLHLFKELLIYCGNGRFPLIENSIASSFLATVVYLDAVDKALHEYISTKISVFSSFRIIRYVDDMYILIASDKPIKDLHEAYDEIRNEYSSILKKFGLALNTKKCCLEESKEINQELKKSLYDEYFNNEKHHIEEMFSGELYRFLNKLSDELLLDSIDIEKYNELINTNFSSEDIKFTPSEVFNYFIYEDKNELHSEVVKEKIVELVERSISFISLDPKRLTVMILKTQNDKAIKAFLNHLFIRDRLNKWNSYDTTIAISYLIQRQFMHADLLKILSERNPTLYDYYLFHCNRSTIQCFDSQMEKLLSKVTAKDDKAHYLYFMYLCERKRANYMAAFAYYKNFFDRVTADLDFERGNDPQLRNPNYKAFYKEGALISFYSEIDNSETVIKTAHKLRNSNPLSHASSELLDRDSTSEDLYRSIEDLSKLICEYIARHKDQL